MQRRRTCLVRSWDWAFESEHATIATQPTDAAVSGAAPVGRRLDVIAVIIVVAIVIPPMLRVRGWTHSAIVARVTHFDPAIHVAQVNACTASAKLSIKAVSHILMVHHMQSEVILDPPTYCGRINLRFRVRRQDQREPSIDGREVDG